MRAAEYMKAVGLWVEQDARLQAENKRLKAVNAQLLEALKDAQKALDSAEAVWTPGDPPAEIDHWVLDPIPHASSTSHIRAAIKAATEG